jgi:hypothetical protein
MSTLKVASLLFLAGAVGVIVAVLIGPSQPTDYLLNASLASFALGAVVLILHIFINLWADFTRSA